MSITATYFTGYYRISQDAQVNTILSEYITKFEKKYLVDLLGYDLYQLFIADFSGGVPQTAIYETIYNELNYDPDSSDSTFIPSQYNMSNYACNFRSGEVVPTLSLGMSEMLKGFVFFHFVSDMNLQVSPTGVISNKNENAEVFAGKTLEFIEARYNESIDSYKVIRRYLQDNLSVYPTFKGVEKGRINWGGAF